jgi:DNA-binding NarL/FixJ family response regulator
MNILLADDQPKVRSALKFLLEQDPRLKVVGEVAEAKELLLAVRTSCPDVVLLDWELPGLSASCTLDALRACARLAVVALSGRPEARQAALAAGADAFVSKGEPPENLLTALDDLNSAI